MDLEEFEAVLIMFGFRKRKLSPSIAAMHRLGKQLIEKMGVENQWYDSYAGAIFVRILDGQCHVSRAGKGWGSPYSFEDGLSKILRMRSTTHDS